MRGVQYASYGLWKLSHYVIFAEIWALEMSLTLEKIREKETKIRDEVDSDFIIKYILECQMNWLNSHQILGFSQELSMNVFAGILNMKCKHLVHFNSH